MEIIFTKNNKGIYSYSRLWTFVAAITTLKKITYLLKGKSLKKNGK